MRTPHAQWRPGWQLAGSCAGLTCSPHLQMVKGGRATREGGPPWHLTCSGPQVTALLCLGSQPLASHLLSDTMDLSLYF